MILFPDPVILQDAGIILGVRVFRLGHRFRYLSSLGVIEVPAGFLTDGASIPRAFWSVLDPLGPYFPAAIVHDYLYSAENHRFTRRQADMIFKEAMFNAGLDWPRREMIYRAVRALGAASYRGLY